MKFLKALPIAMFRNTPACLTVILTLGVTFAVGSGEARAESRAEKPNILLILSDDQAWTDYGFMGHTVIQTPRLDRLASESAVFPNGYVPTSLCRPSLATLITGQYPHQHGVTGNDPPKGTSRGEMVDFVRHCPRLPELLSDAGYVCHQSGKWWEGHHSEGGFTHGMTQGDPERGGRHGDQGLKIGREGIEPIENFLDETAGEPFFLWYAPFLPHTPHNPPGRLLRKYRTPGRELGVAKYYAMCEWFDESCGQVLDALDERGLTDNTIVLYVCDNGWIQPTPDKKTANWRHHFAPKSKRSPYDAGLRTPIMVKWPGHVAPARYDSLISSLDLPVTALNAAGLGVPEEMSGENLLEIIDDKGKTDRDAVFGAVYTHDLRSLRDPTQGLLTRWCRMGDWKLIIPATEDSVSTGDKQTASGTTLTGETELYNLAEDPDETTNLIGDHPEKAAALRERIEDWYAPRWPKDWQE
ncbi:sulfatase family protein [Stratiformator vulcanicus]|uniref:Arylsulfatase n=1 Tax=Stratiformator vulcanicus TaxID=2527980 RepID=A0A517QWG7_9PLAN|nr:sulfatase [Stratiformator vulcanicus]QDT35923.1 Arylsulfatase [Stratiformator vulcanicus]